MRPRSIQDAGGRRCGIDSGKLAFQMEGLMKQKRPSSCYLSSKEKRSPLLLAVELMSRLNNNNNNNNCYFIIYFKNIYIY